MERPERVVREPREVGTRKSVADVRGFMPDRVLDRLKNNEQLKACCRDSEAHDVQLFDTHGDAKPDLMVLICNTCGCKHRIFAGGTGRP